MPTATIVLLARRRIIGGDIGMIDVMRVIGSMCVRTFAFLLRAHGARMVRRTERRNERRRDQDDREQ